MRQARSRTGWLDGFAVGASALCLIHCVAPPILVALGPSASRLLGLPEWLRLAAFAAALPVSALAMHRGYRHHGTIWPAILSCLGLALIGIGALAGEELLLETGLTVVGSVLLAVAHLNNLRLSRRSRPRGAAAGLA